MAESETLQQLRIAAEREFDAARARFEEEQRRFQSAQDAWEEQMQAIEVLSQLPVRGRSETNGVQEVGVTDAVRRILRGAKRPMQTAEIAQLAEGVVTKPPRNKTIRRAVAGAIHKLKQSGQIEERSEGRYMLSD